MLNAAQRRVLLVACIGVAVLITLDVARGHSSIGRPECGRPIPRQGSVSSEVWLADAISDVPCVDSGRVDYDVRHHGAVLDLIDPIADPAGGYIGVYDFPFNYHGHGTFLVGLARSTNLVSWKQVRSLVSRDASAPALTAIPGGHGYLLAYEASHALENGDTVELRYYRSLHAVGTNRVAAQVDLPQVLSRFNNGTPWFLSVDWRGGLRRSVIRLAFDYEAPTAAGLPGFDRDAVGVLRGFRSWSASSVSAVNAALNSVGLAGDHGDSRQFSLFHQNWRVYEADTPLGGFRGWHVVLDDISTNRMYPLRIDVAGGPFSTSFGNPIVSVLPAPSGHGQVLAVTMFVFGSGPAGRDGGELVYYRPL